MNDKDLMDAAMHARENAYTPYSGFQVGAALLCEDGTLYTGCNIEAASYGNTICAERTALCKAVSDGKRRFSMIAVAALTDDPCTPCGICRQKLMEFAPELVVLCGDIAGGITVFSLQELLPHAFSAKDFAG